MRIGRNSALTVVFTAVLSAPASFASSADVQVRVLDREGIPVPEVAVYLRRLNSDGANLHQPEERVSRPGASGNGPTMNQVDLAFDPHILIVETGTAVAFPNEDAVRHHVYSFSPAKRFDMTIDSASVHSERLVFDTAGVVTLGCNIHDDMLAYVLVVDTPHFIKTDIDGIAHLSGLESGEYLVGLWTPRLAENKLPDPDVVSLSADQSLELEYQFDSKLYPPHEHSETSLHWSHY